MEGETEGMKKDEKVGNPAYDQRKTSATTMTTHHQWLTAIYEGEVGNIL